MTSVRSPASSANLGPGFDVLGVAVDRYVYANDEGDGDRCPTGHIARIAFERAGGRGDIWFRHEVPPARGMGFSAAARAAGAALAFAQQGDPTWKLQRRSFHVVSELEGHGDNAAPAVYGGIHVVAGDTTHRLAAQLPGELLLWVPSEATTSTDKSRSTLEPMLLREDAVFNLGRLALLMAAIYEQNIHLLHDATGDRLHQRQRFESQPVSAAAYGAAIAAGAAAAWLSGSGPTVGIIVHPGRSAPVIEALPEGGEVIAVSMDLAGTIEV